jgi:hypothetical protein
MLGITDEWEVMKSAVDMGSCDIIYIPNFMITDSGIQVILRLTPQQSDRLQCWYF